MSATLQECHGCGEWNRAWISNLCDHMSTVPAELCEPCAIGQLLGIMNTHDFAVPEHDPATGMERLQPRKACVEPAHLLTNAFQGVHDTGQRTTPRGTSLGSEQRQLRGRP